MHPLDPFGFGRPGYEKHARSFDPRDLTARLDGLTVAITGANSGLGLAASRALGRMGASVLMLCRDRERGEAARRTVPGDARVVLLDVSDLAAVRALELPRPDVLVHNAGALLDRREVVGGLERTVATHVVGPWLLGHRVKAPTTIWVSSGGMYTQRLEVDRTFDPPEPFDGVTAYARCKRAQLVIARHLGQHVMHPGWADSPGVESSLPGFYKLTRSVLRTPEQGADTIVWLATKRPEKADFWFDRAPAPEHRLPFTRCAPAEEERLLARLQELTGVG